MTQRARAITALEADIIQWEDTAMIEMLTAMLLAGSQVAVDVPAPPPTGVLPAWLSGCWMADGEAGSRTEECWTAPRGEMLLGSSHSFVGDQSTWFEHMRIVREGGALIFIAQPGGAPPTRFPAATRTTVNGVETLVFENAANDFPQRITYRYVHARHWELNAEIAMLDGSRAQSWTYRRP